MSLRNPNKASKSSPVDQYDAPSPIMQAKLSARQAKRAAKAAERRERSEALREEGNTFYRKGDYQNAVDRYQQAIRVHGRSVKPILLTNLAAAYHNLGKFYEASEAAEKALDGDPKSVKARYRRAMARKGMEMWHAAAIDFRIVLRLDPRYQEVKKELAYVEKCHYENRTFFDDEGMQHDSEYELPGPDDEPELGESLSEWSDCEHAGNGRPCKFYNHTECTKRRACQFSHAPDHQSERDALGRNVCRYYLMGLCRFGERCSYLHSKEFLLQKGWWSTVDGIDKMKNHYNFQQKLKKAAIDYEKENKPSFKDPDAGPAQRKKRSSRQTKRPYRARSNLGRSRSEAAAGPGGDRSIQDEPGQSPQPKDSNDQTKYAADSYSSLEDYDPDDGDEEYGVLGFTNDEVEELLCHGIKPWDNEARDFLEALHDAYRKFDALELREED